MKIAILTDIHANLPALEAVVGDLRELTVDQVWVGGDLVGRGPQGSAVVRRIRELGWPCVRGNHEDYLVSFRNGDVPESWHHEGQWAASRWMAAELEPSDVSYIAGLPFSWSWPEAGITLVHGSTVSNCDGLGPWTADARLEAELAAVGGGVLVCGHTHRPLCRGVAGGVVVNAGAVGLPFNGDRRAQYVILHRHDGGWRPEFRRVGYRVSDVLDVYHQSGFLLEGGVTARLLRLELERAAPFLVPFLKWAELTRRPVENSQVDLFVGCYDPREPIERFLRRTTDRAE